MVKAVLDSNIWLSGVFWRGKPHEIVKLAESKKIQTFITKEILAEILDVLNKEKFRRLMEDPGVQTSELMRTILNISTLVEAKEKLDVIKEDPTDNKILECAVAASAEYVVTGDKHLLELKKFGGIRFVKAKEFLDIAK